MCVWDWALQLGALSGPMRYVAINPIRLKWRHEVRLSSSRGGRRWQFALLLTTDSIRNRWNLIDSSAWNPIYMSPRILLSLNSRNPDNHQHQWQIHFTNVSLSSFSLGLPAQGIHIIMLTIFIVTVFISAFSILDFLASDLRSYFA